jgi:ribonuclease HI
VNGKNPAVAKDGSKDDRFYAVASGHEPGIYTSWDQASLAIKGCKGPKYKKFGTRAEAVEFIREHGGEAAQKTVADEPDMPSAKKAKKSSATEATSGTGEEAGIVHIYTDGSSLNNGRAGAAAGVGVFFGAGDSRCVLSLYYRHRFYRA